MQIQTMPIEGTNEVRSVDYRNYKNFCFSDIGYGCKDDSGFINYETITFEDYVSNTVLTGNELLYYPALAVKMRELKEYPTLKRSYKIDRQIKGIAFIEYFCRRTKQSFDNFQHEIIAASNTVINLIHQYGIERHTPIINEIEIEQYGSNNYCKNIVINGVKWEVACGSRYRSKITDYIDLYRLFNIPQILKRVMIEQAIVGTSFIAVRVAKTYSHKGRVYWYSLDTCKQVSGATIKKLAL